MWVHLSQEWTDIKSCHLVGISDGKLKGFCKHSDKCQPKHKPEYFEALCLCGILLYSYACMPKLYISANIVE
jgi:hypothetical protein